MTPFAVEATPIDGLHVCTLKSVPDPRGPIREFFRRSAFEGALGQGALPERWLQVNVTQTNRGAVRGMHAEPMQKLVGVVAGRALGAWVDLRPGPGFGTVVTADLSPGRQVLVPPGVANGFQAVSDEPVQYLYCFDREWEPGMDGLAVNPLDPALAIPWPLPVDPADRRCLSEKDALLPPLSNLRASRR